MKNNLDVKDICKIIWELEKKYLLIDYTISNVKFWQISRFVVYRYLSTLIGAQEQAHTNLTSFQKSKKLFKYIFNSVFHNPFFNKKVDIIILSHPRPKYVNGEYIDIYTRYFLDRLEEENTSFLELESAYLGEHKKNIYDKTTYTDFIVLITNIFSRFISIKLSAKEKKFINKINQELTDKFELNIDITTLLTVGIQKFKIRYFLYKKLLVKLEPHTLYIVPSYGNSSIISAAKNLGIKVIEIQHGIFSDFHLGYSYPQRTKPVDYFPNEFLVWNKYWKDLMHFPIPYENIKIKPFEYLEINKYKYNNLEKIEQLVVLSQGNIGNKLAQLILERFELFKSIKILYKLHPGEYDRYKFYPALTELVNKHKNIEVLEEINLHKLLATSKYQLGINSTALLEGVEFGCKTILFDVSGIEYMTKFIKFHKLEKKKNMFVSHDIVKDFRL